MSKGIDVIWFGARGSALGGNETSKIQAAIDHCFSRGGGFVDFDAKTYQGEVVLKSGVKLRGQGHNSLTTLQAPSVQGQSAVVRVIDAGPIVDIGMFDMRLSGNGHVGQHGFYAVSTPRTVAPFDGGVWYSNFSTLDIVGFDGSSMWFRGGTSDYLLPMQFCNFYNLLITMGSSNGTRAMKMTGQNGQMNFYGGAMQGPGRLAAGGGLLCEVGRDGGLEDAAVGAIQPYSVNFFGTTFEQAPRGIVFDSAFGCSLVSAYLEEMKYAVRVKSSAFGIEVRGGRFGNAAFAGDGTGYLLSAESNSDVFWDPAVTDGTVDNEVTCPLGVATVNFGQTSAMGTSTNRDTDNSTRQIGAAATINLGATRTWIIEGTTQVANINASVYPGDTVHLRSHNGAVSYVNTGNISLGGTRTSPLSVPQFAMATFVRMDLAATWQLVSVS